MNITASGTFHGTELTDIPVINAGSFGKTWLLEIGGAYSPLFLIVEADSVCDAIDELADSEEFGHHIIVDGNLDDYPEESRHYGPHGQVLDLDHLMIYGDESKDQPFPCRYFGDGLPTEGIEPSEIWEYDLSNCDESEISET